MSLKEKCIVAGQLEHILGLSLFCLRSDIFHTLGKESAALCFVQWNHDCIAPVARLNLAHTVTAGLHATSVALLCKRSVTAVRLFFLKQVDLGSFETQLPLVLVQNTVMALFDASQVAGVFERASKARKDFTELVARYVQLVVSERV